MSTPLVLVPAWTGRRSHAVAVGAWMVVNPVIFPEPADDHAWSTRAVLGEELWIADRPRDAAMLVDGAATMALLLVYWRLMDDYYRQHRSVDVG